jgi:hypothetical protein
MLAKYPQTQIFEKDTRQQQQLAAAADGILIFPCARISPDVNIRPDMLETWSVSTES